MRVTPTACKSGMAAIGSRAMSMAASLRASTLVAQGDSHRSAQRTAMEGELLAACQEAHVLDTGSVTGPVCVQKADHKACHAQRRQGLHVTAYAVKLFIAVQKVAAARADKHVDRHAHPGEDGGNQPEAWGQAPLAQGAA